MSRPDPRLPLPKGLDAFAHRLEGVWARRAAAGRRLRDVVAGAEAAEARARGLAREDLAEAVRACAAVFRRRAARDIDAHLPWTLAVLRELAHRETGLRPFGVQLLGALALHRGWLAEMATGEGKTLVAALAAVLAGWSGRPCHVVTVNDYLASRDAQWFARLFNAAGVRVACVEAATEPAARRDAYGAAVVYTTAKELLADSLRDELRGAWARGRADARPLLRGLHTVIVDEADSVLIDEAVTPLIISRQAPNEELRLACIEAARLAGALVEGDDYQCDRRHRDVELRAEGRARLAALADGLPAVWRGAERREELVEQALQARVFHEEGRQFVVEDGKVVIVDEFTGRLMRQRTWRDGLQQAVEASSGLEVSSPTETLGRRSFQRFFRGFPHVCGMTGTAWEARGELWQVYALPVLRIPTERPVVRVQAPDRVFATVADKLRAVVAEVVRLCGQGRPVLVGTRSVAASEHLAALLASAGVVHQVLNATRHREEAAIIAQAGQAGVVTIATNMAGRGTDIRLGPGVVAAGGLAVLATERHESGRVDRQLFGRAGRQGDPGSAQAFVSWEDELLARHLAGPVRGALRAAGAADRAVRLAQARAQRTAAVQRVQVVRADEWSEESLGWGRS